MGNGDTANRERIGSRRRRRSAPGAVLAVLIPLVVTQPVLSVQSEPRTSESRQTEEDLSRRLIRKAMSQSDEDLMDGILRLMSEAQRKLEVEFDAGEETRAMQAEIADKLDKAIEAAARQRRPRRRTPSESHPDKRRMPSAAKRDAEKAGSAAGKAAGSSTSGDVASTGETESADSLAGDLHDVRRGWGHLPSRERDEIIQGISEGYLERYRVWIEQYYKALQETDE